MRRSQTDSLDSWMKFNVAAGSLQGAFRSDALGPSSEYGRLAGFEHGPGRNSTCAATDIESAAPDQLSYRAAAGRVQSEPL